MTLPVFLSKTDLPRMTQSCVHQEVLGADIQLVQEVRERISLSSLQQGVAQLGAKSSCSMLPQVILHMERKQPR